MTILLKEVKTAPRAGVILENPTQADLDLYLPDRNSNRLGAIDFETTGLEFEDTIVGASLADAEFPAGVYFSFRNCSEEWKKEILLRLISRPLIAHNAQFEQFMTWNTLGQYARIQYDTQGLLNQIEGDWAQQVGKDLKTLQVELLGWRARGDVELSRWLVENGFLKKPIPQNLMDKLTTPQAKEPPLPEPVFGQEYWDKVALRAARAEEEASTVPSIEAALRAARDLIDAALEAKND